LSVNVPKQLSVYRDPSGFDRCTLLTVHMDRTTASIDQESKVVYDDVTVSFDIVTNSYQYGDQLQIVARTTTKPHTEKRVQSHNGQSFRIEPFYLDLPQVPELIWSLMQQWEKYLNMTSARTTRGNQRILTAQSNVADILQ